MPKVLIGMSGGVDSSVSAYLLKKEGYEVIGATMVLTDNTENNQKAINDAKNVCDKLNIPHIVINFQKEFKSRVIDNLINEYLNGHTPNPCIECNKYLKFSLLWDKAQELKCDYIATGHYANINNGKLERIDSPKDQSYFMYKINKTILSHILLPLNKYSNKEEIRRIAEEIGLKTHDKKDSQDICFIEDQKYSNFLEKNIKNKPVPGNFILTTGEIIGKHQGIIYYTIGQRKGLGISYKEPLYVINIDPKTNNIILGSEKDLYSEETTIKDINILVDELPSKAMAKIRYKAPLTPCTITKINDNEYKIIFDKPVKSITKGQSLVLYQENTCLGGGIIS